MAGEQDEDLLADCRAQYRQNLPSLLRKLHLTEEDSLPSSIELQKTKKEAQEMQKALEEAKEDFKERMEVINHRWRDLRGRQAQLKAYIETSEKILKEHDGTRSHALKKARKEREKMQKESELVRAKETLEALKKQHQQLRDKVQKFSIFKEYLEDVVKVSQFEDIQELIEHYKMLVTRKDQLQSQQKHEEMSEQGQVLLNQHTAETAAEIERLKNELKDLQLRHDQAQKDVLQWGAALADIQNRASKSHLELETIKMAILNIFQCLSTWLNTDPKVLKDDSLKQLDMIQQFIQGFADLSLEEKQKDRRNRQGADLPSKQ